MTADAGALAGKARKAWRFDLNPRVAAVAGSVGARLAVGALAVLVAFHFSLLSLVRNLGLDTPLAYLGLVPFISIGIALALPRTNSGPAIYDRQLDHIIGLPLVAAAVIAIKVLPQRLSTIYWDDRLDLLTLPFFVFAVSVLLFGMRTTWRYRIPIFFLLMAWPLPYALAIEHAIDLSTSTTISALAWTLHFLPLATQNPGGDGSIFTIPHGSGSFPVSIASACAGVNSLVGFVLVGTAFLAVVGRKTPPGGGTPPKALGRKMVWLAFGLVLVWGLNIVRLLMVLWTGKHFGSAVALDGLHPFIGVVLFAGAIVVLLLAMPLLGLQAFPGQQLAARAPKAESASGIAGRVAVAKDRLSRPIAAKGPWRLATAVTVAAAVVVGVTDSSFAHFELLASDFGTPKVMGFDAAPPNVNGYVGDKTNTYDWVKQYFTNAATWNRYTYEGTGASVQPASYTSGAGSTAGAAAASTPNTAGQTLIADVIDTPDLGKFNAYGIEACYRFHGYTFSPEQPIDLGAGVRGYTLAYLDPSTNTTWSVLYWVWAVQTKQGKRFERVVLLHPSSAQAISAADPVNDPLKGVGYNAQGNKAVSPSAQDISVEHDFATAVINHQPLVPKTRTQA